MNCGEGKSAQRHAFQNALATTAALSALAAAQPYAASNYVSLFGGRGQIGLDGFGNWQLSLTGTETAYTHFKHYNGKFTVNLPPNIYMYAWYTYREFQSQKTSIVRHAASGTADGSLDASFVLGAAFGRQFVSNVRVELEAAYRSADGALKSEGSDTIRVHQDRVIHSRG